MRVKAGPDAAVARLHASTCRPDIRGTVPYDSSLLRHCACCREQHDGSNCKNTLQHRLPPDDDLTNNTQSTEFVCSDIDPNQLCFCCARVRKQKPGRIAEERLRVSLSRFISSTSADVAIFLSLAMATRNVRFWHLADICFCVACPLPLKW